MDDRHDPNLILGYVEDELVAADRDRVEALLADDPALASLVADLQRNRAALRGATPIEPPAGLADGAMAALERHMLFEDAAPASTAAAAVSPAPSRFRLAPLLTYGGIAAVLALTVTVVFQSLQSDPSSTATIAMNDAPSQGMSLAEATIDAQRKAAMKRQASDPSIETDAADAAEMLTRESQVAAGLDLDLDAESAAFLADAAQPGESSEGNIAFVEDGKWQMGRRGETPGAAVAADAVDLLQPDIASEPAFALSRSAREIEAAKGRADDAEALAALDTDPFESDAAASSFALRRSEPSPAPAVTAPAAPLPEMPPPAVPLTVQNPLAEVAASDAEAVEFRLRDHHQRLGRSNAAQRITLNVFTASPDRSRQQLSDWAASNRITLASAVPPSASPNEAFALDESIASPKDFPPSESERLTIPPRLNDAHWAKLDRALAIETDRESLGAQLSDQLRVQLKVNPSQVSELVAALSDPAATIRQDVVPTAAQATPTRGNSTAVIQTPWMNWQTPLGLNEIEVEVVIEARPNMIAPAKIELP